MSVHCVGTTAAGKPCRNKIADSKARALNRAASWCGRCIAKPENRDDVPADAGFVLDLFGMRERDDNDTSTFKAFIDRLIDEGHAPEEAAFSLLQSTTRNIEFYLASTDDHTGDIERFQPTISECVTLVNDLTPLDEPENEDIRASMLEFLGLSSSNFCGDGGKLNPSYGFTRAMRLLSMTNTRVREMLSGLPAATLIDINSRHERHNYEDRRRGSADLVDKRDFDRACWEAVKPKLEHPALVDQVKPNALGTATLMWLAAHVNEPNVQAEIIAQVDDHATRYVANGDENPFDTLRLRRTGSTEKTAFYDMMTVTDDDAADERGTAAWHLQQWLSPASVGKWMSISNPSQVMRRIACFSRRHAATVLAHPSASDVDRQAARSFLDAMSRYDPTGEGDVGVLVRERDRLQEHDTALLQQCEGRTLNGERCANMTSFFTASAPTRLADKIWCGRCLGGALKVLGYFKMYADENEDKSWDSVSAGDISSSNLDVDKARFEKLLNEDWDENEDALHVRDVAAAVTFGVTTISQKDAQRSFADLTHRSADASRDESLLTSWWRHTVASAETHGDAVNISADDLRDMSQNLDHSSTLLPFINLMPSKDDSNFPQKWVDTRAIGDEMVDDMIKLRSSQRWGNEIAKDSYHVEWNGRHLMRTANATGTNETFLLNAHYNFTARNTELADRLGDSGALVEGINPTKSSGRREDDKRTDEPQMADSLVGSLGRRSCDTTLLLDADPSISQRALLAPTDINEAGNTGWRAEHIKHHLNPDLNADVGTRVCQPGGPRDTSRSVRYFRRLRRYFAEHRAWDQDTGHINIDSRPVPDGGTAAVALDDMCDWLAKHARGKRDRPRRFGTLVELNVDAVGRAYLQAQPYWGGTGHKASSPSPAADVSGDERLYLTSSNARSTVRGVRGNDDEPLGRPLLVDASFLGVAAMEAASNGSKAVTFAWSSGLASLPDAESADTELGGNGLRAPTLVIDCDANNERSSSVFVREVAVLPMCGAQPGPKVASNERTLNGTDWRQHSAEYEAPNERFGATHYNALSAGIVTRA